MRTGEFGSTRGSMNVNGGGRGGGQKYFPRGFMKKAIECPGACAYARDHVTQEHSSFFHDRT